MPRATATLNRIHNLIRLKARLFIHIRLRKNSVISSNNSRSSLLKFLPYLLRELFHFSLMSLPIWANSTCATKCVNSLVMSSYQAERASYRRITAPDSNPFRTLCLGVHDEHSQVSLWLAWKAAMSRTSDPRTRAQVDHAYKFLCTGGMVNLGPACQ
jgi:hypothetical protein